LAVEAGRTAFDQVLHLQRLGVVIVNVLLHLVQDDEGERELAGVRALQAKHLFERVEHLVVTCVVDHRELRLQGDAHRRWRIAEAGSGVDKGLCENRRHVEIAKLVRQVLSFGLNRGPYRAVDRLLVHPQSKACRAVLVRKIRCVEDNSEKRQANGA